MTIFCVILKLVEVVGKFQEIVFFENFRILKIFFNILSTSLSGKAQEDSSAGAEHIFGF